MERMCPKMMAPSKAQNAFLIEGKNNKSLV